MSGTPQPRWYKRHLLFPVLDDNGAVEYWDIHEDHGEETVDNDPIAWGLPTLAAAKEWVTASRRVKSVMRLVDR